MNKKIFEKRGNRNLIGRYIVVTMVLVTLISSPVFAKEIKSIAVLPFSVHSAENIDYVRSGVWDMLISRLSSSGEIDVIEKFKISEAIKDRGDMAASDVYELGKEFKVDYVAWGSITKIGKSVSLDGKLMDIATYKTPVGIFEQCRNSDDIIPKIGNFASKVQNHILGRTPSVPVTSSQTDVPVSESSSRTVQMSDSEDAFKSRKGTLTSVYNPEFVAGAGPLDREGYWMSKRFPVRFKGMDIGDVNNDGLNEIITIDDYNIYIYQKDEKELRQLAKIEGEKYDNYLSIDVADINGNGTDEIIITNVRAKNRLYSFVMEYEEDNYVKIADGLGWFLRVIKTGNKSPKLIGQVKGVDPDKPYEKAIRRILWRGGKYTEGEKMKIPEGMSVYGLTIDSIEGKGKVERIIALDEYDHIRLYVKTDKPISKIHVVGGSDEVFWKSDDVFGGTDVSFHLKDNPSMTNDDEEHINYANSRILTYDTNNDGKREVIIVKNLSLTGRALKNTRAFSKAELYNLEWDGLGLIQNWKTKKIGGYVSDYHIKDMDNDGDKEVVMSLCISPKRSVIVAYDLNVQ